MTNLQPWEYAGYVYNPSHRNEKMDAIRESVSLYFMHSKGHINTGVQSDGSVTELESQDVIILENEFPSRKGIDIDI